ncbi:MAG: ATP-binding protein [Candidatus Hodarchaeota archaeon]
MNNIDLQFFISNFGPYIGPHGPIPLDQFTWFTGTNGSGKTALLDAIKTLFLCKKEYIKYNPDGDDERTQRDYIRTFQKGAKKGPTILALHVTLFDEFRELKLLFGISCEQSIRWKFFLKEEIDIGQSDLIIKNSASSNELISSLTNPALLGFCPKISNIREYHELLRKYEIFYTPPISQKNSDYHQYLMLLKESTEAFAGKKRLDIEKIKRSLFHNLSDPRIVSETLNQIRNGIFEFNNLSEKKIITETRLNLLEGLLLKYQEHYEDLVLQSILLNLFYNEKKIEEYNLEVEEYKKKIENMKIDNLDLEGKIDENHKVIPSLEITVERINDFILTSRDSYNFFQQYKEKYINKEKDFYTKKWKELHEISERWNEDLKKLRNQYKTIRNKEKTIENEIEEKKKKKKKMEDDLTTLKKNILKQREEEEGISNDLAELENVQIRISENNQKSLKEWEKVRELLEKSLSPQMKTLSSKRDLLLLNQSIKDEKREIKLTEKRHQGFLSEITELKGLKFKDVEIDEEKINFLKNKYQFFQVLDLFETFQQYKTPDFESLLRPYMNYFVLTSSNYERLEEFSVELLKIGILDAGFLHIDQNETQSNNRLISKLQEKFQLGWIIRNELAHLSKIEPPVYFNKNLREKKIREYEDAVKTLENEIKLRNIDTKEIELRCEELNKLAMLLNYEKTKINEKYKTINFKKILNEKEKIRGIIREKITKFELNKEKNIEEIVIFESGIQNLERSQNELTSRKEEIKLRRDTKRKQIRELEDEIIEAEKEATQYEQIRQEFLTKLDHLQKETEWILEQIPDRTEILIDQFLNDLEYLELLKTDLETERKKFSRKLRNLALEVEIWGNKITQNQQLIKELEEKKVELDISLNQLNKNNTTERTQLKEYFDEKLLKEVVLYERFNPSYSDWYKNRRKKIESSISNCQKNLNISLDDCYRRLKTTFVSRIAEERADFTNSLLPKILEIFKLPQIGSFTDSKNNITLKYLHKQLDLSLDSIKIRKYFNQKIEEITSEISSITQEFQDNLQLLVDLIKEQIKSSHKKVRELNNIATLADFGKMGKIEFIFQTNTHYESLKNSEKKLLEAIREEKLNNLINGWFGDSSGSFTDNLAKFIFEDNSKKEKDLIDVFNYYDFDVESIRPTGERLRATKGSTGESIGLKFLIFTAIIDSFKRKIGQFTQSKGTIFLYVDEIARLDPKGINSIIEISKKFDVSVFFAERNLPKTIVDDQLSYIIENGIILPGSSELLLGAERTFDIS